MTRQELEELVKNKHLVVVMVSPYFIARFEKDYIVDTDTLWNPYKVLKHDKTTIQFSIVWDFNSPMVYTQGFKNEAGGFTPFRAKYPILYFPFTNQIIDTLKEE